MQVELLTSSRASGTGDDRPAKLIAWLRFATPVIQLCRKIHHAVILSRISRSEGRSIADRLQHLAHEVEPLADLDRGHDADVVDDAIHLGRDLIEH